MAKAYKCDICGVIYEGITDMQLGLSKGLETVLRFTLGVRFSPENQEAPMYIKDCCPGCAKDFVVWYRDSSRKIRKSKIN